MDHCTEGKVKGQRQNQVIFLLLGLPAAPWNSSTCCLGEGEPALLPPSTSTSTQMFKRTPQNSRRGEPELAVAMSPPPVPDRVLPRHLQQQMKANFSWIDNK